MKRTQPKRDWTDARLKVDRAYGACLVCGEEWQRYRGRKLEAAHTASRSHDEPKPCPVCRGEGMLAEETALLLGYAPSDFCPYCAGEGSQDPDTLYVDPDDIAVLCGPATDTSTCHGRFDAHELDILSRISTVEQLRVVKHLGSIESARLRLSPSDYRVVAA